MLNVRPPLAPPDDDDRAAWWVASDAIAERRVELADRIITERAPRALNAQCPACGAKPGARCTRRRTCGACGGTGGWAMVAALAGGPVADGWCQSCLGSGGGYVAIVLPHSQRLGIPGPNAQPLPLP